MKKFKLLFLFCTLSALTGCGSNSSTINGEKAAESFEGKLYYQVAENKMKVFDINTQVFETTGIVNYANAYQYKDGILYNYSMSSDGYNHSTPSRLCKEKYNVEAFGNVLVVTNSPTWNVFIDSNKMIIQYSSSSGACPLFYTEAYAKAKGIEIVQMK